MSGCGVCIGWDYDYDLHICRGTGTHYRIAVVRGLVRAGIGDTNEV